MRGVSGLLVWSWAWLAPLVASAQPGAASVLIQDTSTSISYTGAWSREDDTEPWSNGTAALSMTAGAKATLTFTGVEVSWLGLQGTQGGIARVFLDGALAATIDSFASVNRVQGRLFSAAGLTDASHTCSSSLHISHLSAVVSIDDAVKKPPEDAGCSCGYGLLCSYSFHTVLSWSDHIGLINP